MERFRAAPLFGGEGGSGELGLVVEVGGREAGPAVADVARVRDVGAGDEDGFAVEGRGSGDELVVVASDFEAENGVAARVEAGGVVEPEAESGAFDGGLAVERAGEFNVFAVGCVAGC